MSRRTKGTIDVQMATAEVRWESVYEMHADDIVRYLRRIVREEETATDLMQDTFVRAMRAQRRPAMDAELRPWLFRIASNLAISHLRRRRFNPLSAPLAIAETSRVEPDEHLRLALGAIAPEQAVTLTLAFHDGFSRREIAGILGISEEAVKSRIARGRLNFTAAYRRLGRGLRA